MFQKRKKSLWWIICGIVGSAFMAFILWLQSQAINQLTTDTKPASVFAEDPDKTFSEDKGGLK